MSMRLDDRYGQLRYVPAPAQGEQPTPATPEALARHLEDDHGVPPKEIRDSGLSPEAWHEGMHSEKNDNDLEQGHWHFPGTIWDEHKPSFEYVADIRDSDLKYYIPHCACGWKSNIRSEAAAAGAWSRHVVTLDEGGRKQRAGPPTDRSQLPVPKRHAMSTDRPFLDSLEFHHRIIEDGPRTMHVIHAYAPEGDDEYGQGSIPDSETMECYGNWEQGGRRYEHDSWDSCPIHEDGGPDWARTPVGSLSWTEQSKSDAPPYVEHVRVSEDHQRKGLATELWNHAKSAQPDLQHDAFRSPEGDSWVESLPKESMKTAAEVDDSALDRLHTEGGFTVHDETGERAKGPGYLVSVKGHQEAFDPKDVTAATMEHYRVRHGVALGSALWGGWDNRKIDGKLYLDVSEHHPDFQSALTAANKHYQRTFFRLPHTNGKDDRGGYESALTASDQDVDVLDGKRMQGDPVVGLATRRSAAGPIGQHLTLLPTQSGTQALAAWDKCLTGPCQGGPAPRVQSRRSSPRPATATDPTTSENAGGPAQNHDARTHAELPPRSSPWAALSSEAPNGHTAPGRTNESQSSRAGWYHIESIPIKSAALPVNEYSKRGAWLDQVTAPYQQDAVKEPKQDIEPVLPPIYEGTGDPEDWRKITVHPVDLFSNPKTGARVEANMYVRPQPGKTFHIWREHGPTSVCGEPLPTEPGREWWVDKPDQDEVCPTCRHMLLEQDLDQMRQEREERIEKEHRDFPLPGDKVATARTIEWKVISYVNVVEAGSNGQGQATQIQARLGSDEIPRQTDHPRSSEDDEDSGLTFPSHEDLVTWNQAHTEAAGEPHHIDNPDVSEWAISMAEQHHATTGDFPSTLAHLAHRLAAGQMWQNVGDQQIFADANHRTAFTAARHFAHANGYGHLLPHGEDPEFAKALISDRDHGANPAKVIGRLTQLFRQRDGSKTAQVQGSYHHCENDFCSGDDRYIGKDRIPPAETEGFEKLRQRILGDGEHLVVPPGGEEDLSKIVERGQNWDGHDATLMKGLPINCHGNAAALHTLGYGRIATGYACSENGYWTQHSWAVGDDNKPIETTVPRVKYHGVILNQDEADTFVAHNSDRDSYPGLQKKAATYYHVAPREDRESIEQHGIDYRGHSVRGDEDAYEGSDGKAANYLWKTQEAAENYIRDAPDSDVYEVTLPRKGMEKDPYFDVWPQDLEEYPGGAVRTNEPIHPSRVRRITGQGLVDHHSWSQDAQKGHYGARKTFMVDVKDLHDVPDWCVDDYEDEQDTMESHGHGWGDDDHRKACEELGQRMKAGYDPGPIVVCEHPIEPQKWLVLDGTHRAYAAQLAGLDQIEAVHERDEHTAASSGCQNTCSCKDTGVPCECEDCVCHQKTSGLRLMYHVTDPKYRDSILQHGIDYTRGESHLDEFEGAEPGNYLYADDPKLPHSDLWKVDVNDLPLDLDPYDDDAAEHPTAYYTPDPIPKHRVELVRRGKPHEALAGYDARWKTAMALTPEEDLPAKLQDTINEFRKLPNVHRLSDPDEAHDRCGPASKDFANFAESRGHDVEVRKLRQDPWKPGWAQNSQSEHDNYIGYRHSVPFVDGHYVDWTARQYAPDSPVPRIYKNLKDGDAVVPEKSSDPEIGNHPFTHYYRDKGERQFRMNPPSEGGWYRGEEQIRFAPGATEWDKKYRPERRDTDCTEHNPPCEACAKGVSVWSHECTDRCYEFPEGHIPARECKCEYPDFDPVDRPSPECPIHNGEGPVKAWFAKNNKTSTKTAALKPTWRPIAEHAKHYDDFDQFRHDFVINNYHGTYWHLTDKPDFKIDPNQSPHDASSMASGEGGDPGLMVSTDPENWRATLGKGRQYAAQIDLSDAKPNVDFKDTTRGFGHEIYVFKPEKARVVRVMPYEHAVKKVNRLYHGGQLPQSEDELQTIWNEAHPARVASIISAVDDIPPRPGTAPIPEGHVRIYHATWADPEVLKREGLSMQKARESYERGSTEFPAIFGYAGHHPALEAHESGGGANVVEFHLHPDDLDIGRGRTPEDLEARRATVTTMKDVPPENIVAVHEPWHAQYHMIKDDPQIEEAVMAGEHDWAMDDDRMKPLGDAIRRVKRENQVPREASAHHGEGPWFHGTNADFKPGDVIAPGKDIGQQHMGEYSDNSRVWLSNVAWRAGAYGSRIYVVEPHSRPKSPYAGHDEHHTTGATVIREFSPDEIRQSWNPRTAASASPLDYKKPGVERISIEDPDFPGDPNHPYFEEPGTVAFLDHTPHGNDVFINYAATHRSQQGQGHAATLLHRLYDQYPGNVEWGSIMDPPMGKLYERFKADPELGPRTHGRNPFKEASRGMADTAQYAGDDYIIRRNGLDPYAPHLDFLPWTRVDSHWVIPDGPDHDFREALNHPEGTTLHEDAPLAQRVEDHFKQHGISVDDVADRFEHVVRTADPWVVNYGKGWYQHEAGHAADRLVSGGYTRHTAAHIIADLSPQNNWLGTPNHPELGNREEAVRYGTEVTNMRQGLGKYKGHVLHVSDDDAEWAHSHFVNKDGQSTATLQPGRYDISGHPSHWDIKPEQLAELPIFHSRTGRRERTHAIKTALGVRHADEFGAKTAAFGHNIDHPLTCTRVTVDTHMADASGAQLTKAAKAKFLAAKGGVKNEGAALGPYGGTTGGYGMAGIASATLEAARKLNETPEKGWGGSQPDLLPHQVQAITWTNHLMGKSRPFREHIETLKTLPWEHVFGYNFERPQAA